MKMVFDIIQILHVMMHL